MSLNTTKNYSKRVPTTANDVIQKILIIIVFSLPLLIKSSNESKCKDLKVLSLNTWGMIELLGSDEDIKWSWSQNGRVGTFCLSYQVTHNCQIVAGSSHATDLSMRTHGNELRCSQLKGLLNCVRSTQVLYDGDNIWENTINQEKFIVLYDDTILLKCTEPRANC